MNTTAPKHRGRCMFRRVLRAQSDNHYLNEITVHAAFGEKITRRRIQLAGYRHHARMRRSWTKRFE